MPSMSPLRLVILAVAILAAIIAAILVSTQSRTPETVEIERIKEVEITQRQVLVAKRDIPVGEVLTADLLRWVNWPDGAVRENYFTQRDAPDAKEALVGSIVRVQLYKFEPIIAQKIIEKGSAGFMAAVLQPGERAVAVQISPEVASGGFILPGNRVDVILTRTEAFSEDGTSADTVTANTMLENVEVLAIDEVFTGTDGAQVLTGSIATLRLTRSQAEIVALAVQTGAISLVLRSVADSVANNGRAIVRFNPNNRDIRGAVSVYRGGADGETQ